MKRQSQSTTSFCTSSLAQSIDKWIPGLRSWTHPNSSEIWAVTVMTHLLWLKFIQKLLKKSLEKAVITVKGRSSKFFKVYRNRLLNLYVTGSNPARGSFLSKFIVIIFFSVVHNYPSSSVLSASVV
uniref:Uncharacterized protein n=1 Tax=Cacopsylla melanoneura TaxID=428564 RepID=A0A8D9BJP7_9HEMI